MKGEITFEVEDVQYRMVLDFNAMCDVESVLGPGIPLNGPSATRAVMWAGLQRNHPQLTILQVGNMIGEKGMPWAAALVQKAMLAGELIGGEESADPPPAAPANRAQKRASRAR